MDFPASNLPHFLLSSSSVLPSIYSLMSHSTCIIELLYIRHYIYSTSGIISTVYQALF